MGRGVLGDGGGWGGGGRWGWPRGNEWWWSWAYVRGEIRLQVSVGHTGVCLIDALVSPDSLPDVVRCSWFPFP